MKFFKHKFSISVKVRRRYVLAFACESCSDSLRDFYIMLIINQLRYKSMGYAKNKLYEITLYDTKLGVKLYAFL